MADDQLEYPELIDEYLSSLQDQIDALHARNESLKGRIAKLERERDRLRDQLPRWRQQRGNRQTRGPSPSEDRTVVVPGVGEFPDVALPDGPVARSDLVVGTVVDDFSRNAFRYEFDLRDIPATNPEESLEQISPDVVLVESAYRGQDGTWAGQIARFGRPSNKLQRLVRWCKDHDVPTIFWVKEDPINHDWFSVSAPLFDVVLTVDSNMLPAYRRRLSHVRIGILPFGAQPVIHHPPESASRPGNVAFAGSYYAAKHPERREQMKYVLEPALASGLQIFDRMGRQDDPRFAWPKIYRDHIVGSLSYPQTLEAYRRYQTFLNVNTVTDSPTMSSRRVYELLASGTRVVSGPADALEGVPVEITRSEEETRRLLSKGPRFDPTEGIAWVRAGNTMSDRVKTILDYL